MKRFLRTAVGKTLLMMAITLMVIISIGSAAGAVIMAEEDFYTTSENTLKAELMKNLLYSKNEEILDEYMKKQDGTPIKFSACGNYQFQLLNEKSEVIAYSEGDTNGVDWEDSYRYGVKLNKNGKMEEYVDARCHGEEKGTYYTLNVSLKPGLPEKDDFTTCESLLHVAYSLRYATYIIGGIAFLLAIFCFVLLMMVAGKRPDSEECQKGVLHVIPFDVMLAGYLGMVVFGAYIFSNSYRFKSGCEMLIFLVIEAVILLNGFLGVAMSASGRIKQGTFWNGMLVCIIVRKTGSLIAFIGRHLSLVYKVALFMAGLSIVEFFALVVFIWDGEVLVLLWAIEKVVMIPTVLYVAIILKKLQKGAENLACGETGYQVDTKWMRGDLKAHGENLNNIASGMTIAVEEQLKSERMKTELITNVSHDIKTPLTSIVNYANLIGQEKCENEKIKEYSEVLLRQSEKMKRLIEDLVEASKASTGNLEVHLMPCNAVTFVTQAEGEYIEKLEAAGLELVVTKSEQDIMIMADGRRMWRIFDNLMNNICKYSKVGTRVYIDLVKKKDAVEISFKNVSKAQLNVSAEELMERFVRGDASRTTEGNGLGLSIARSMVELQNGTMELIVDGDLFKVNLSFPLC